MQCHRVIENVIFPKFEYNYIIPNIDNERINKRFTQLMIDEKLTGFCIGISYKKNNLLVNCYGYQDKENNIKASPETLFRWASVSKSITAILALKLHSQDKLNLNVNINKYIPYSTPKKLIRECNDILYYHNGKYFPCVNGFFEYPLRQGIAIAKKLKNNQTSEYITTTMLLNHSSGISSYLEDNTTHDPMPPQSLSNANKSDDCFDWAIEYFIKNPLVNIPGTEYNYSTFGFNLLGRIVEKVSGESYMTLVDRYIKKGGLPSLIPDRHINKDNYPNRSKGYKKGLPTNQDNDVSFKLPGGGFMSNIADALEYCKNIDDILTLSEKSIAFIPHRFHYGFGFQIHHWKKNEKKRKFYSIGHLGSQENAKSLFRYYPDKKFSFVLLCNSENLEKSTRDKVYKILEEELM